MQYFSPVETPEELRTKFHQRYQGPDETLEHFAMELRVLCSKAYKTMGSEELEDMAKQQFILGVRNNLIRERLIVHRPKNLKEAIEYGRLLEVANRTARGVSNPNVKGVFTAFNVAINPRGAQQKNNRGGYPIGAQTNYFSPNADGAIRQGGPASYSSGYMTPNGPPFRKLITCYTCGKPGHKAYECRSKPQSTVPQSSFVKGQWPPKRSDNGSDTKPKMPQNNMIVQSDEEESDASDDGMVLVGSGGNCQTGILAVKGEIAGKEIEDIIVDSGSAISLISTKCFEKLDNKMQLLPIKGRYMVANGSLLNIKGSVDLVIKFDTLELTHKFLCVDTDLSLALLGYDFIRKNKVDILTSANCLIIQNIPIMTYMRVGLKTIGVILTANETLEPFSENIIEGQADESEAQYTSKETCVLEPELKLEEKLGILIARGLVISSNSIPVRILNVGNKTVTLKGGTKVGDLMPIEVREDELCLAMMTASEKEISINDIIDNALKDETSILTKNEKEKLVKLLLKYESIISRGPWTSESANGSPIRSTLKT